MSKPRLGRGLDILLGQGSPQQSTLTPTGDVRSLPIHMIVRAAHQPRQVFDEEALADLAESIREHGVLQPLLVRPCDDGEQRGQFEIIAGERRWRASQLAGLTEVPVIVHEIEQQRAFQMAIVENLQRENLSPLEEARAYQTLLRQGMNQEQVAVALGKGRSTITNTLRLLTLPPDAEMALEKGLITAGHARALLGHPPEERSWILEKILSQKLTVRATEAIRHAGNGQQSKKRSSCETALGHIALQLSRMMGSRVKIAGESQGRIELHYGSREELERLLVLLGYEQEG